MSIELTTIAASITKQTFLSLAETLLGQEKKKILKISVANLSEAFRIVSSSLIFEFTLAFFKALLNTTKSYRRIENKLSNLIREPYLTAIEQFRIASELSQDSLQEKIYRESRFHDSLLNFDRALSLAEPHEKAFIHILKGLCALNISGAKPEAVKHLKEFQNCCKQEAISLENKATSLVKDAEQKELYASKINPVNMPKGLGGGSLISMSASEPTIEKISIIQEAKRLKVKADNLRKLYEEFIAAAECVEVIILSSQSQI